jgi:hypothetical protein
MRDQKETTVVTYRLTHPQITAGTLYTADHENAETYTISTTDPYEFIRHTLHLMHYGVSYHIEQDKKGCVSIEHVLALCCLKLFSAGKNGTTSCWKHIESGAVYLVAYDYDEDDYYSTAWSYCTQLYGAIA